MKTDVPTQTPTPAPVPAQTPAPTAEKPYFIEVLPLLVDKNYKINPYSFIHSFYSIIFYDFNLTGIIPIEERKYIMKKVYDEIRLGSQVNFVIKKYLGVDKLSFVFFIHSDTRGKNLRLKTNYDEGAGALVPLDMPKEEWIRCFSVIYQLVNSKLVHKTDMYSFYKEDTLLENRQFVDLAHLYIFDEKEENDSQVEEILNKLIIRNFGNEIALKAMLEHAYFYLLNEKVSDADSVINRAAPLFKGKKMEELKWKYMLVEEEMVVLKDFLE